MTFAPDVLEGSKSLATDDPVLLWVYLVFMNGVRAFVRLKRSEEEGGRKEGRKRASLDVGTCWLGASDLTAALPRSHTHPSVPLLPLLLSSSQVWVIVPLLLLWESGAHVVHACAVAKAEQQPRRDRVAGLPSLGWFYLVGGK